MSHDRWAKCTYRSLPHGDCRITSREPIFSGLPLCNCQDVSLKSPHRVVSNISSQFLHVLPVCESVHRTIPRDNFLDYLRQVLTPDAFEAYHHSNIFDKAVFCWVKARYVSKQ